MLSESEIRNQLVRFLAGEISLDEFEDWFVQKSWDAHGGSDPSTQRLASAVELRLAEHSSGHLSEVDLQDELRPFVSQYSVSVSLTAHPITLVSTGASNSFTFRVAQLGQPFGIGLSMASL